MTDIKNKKYCYVVEGKTDEDKLKKCGISFIVKTNGKFLKEDFITLLKLISKHRFLVFMTDPDPTGQQIREHLQEEVKVNYLVIKTKMKESHDAKKIGIAQMKMVNLKRVLESYIEHDRLSNEKAELSLLDLYQLGLTGENSTLKKEKIEKELGVHFYATKEMLLILQMLDFNKEKLEVILKGE